MNIYKYIYIFLMLHDFYKHCVEHTVYMRLNYLCPIILNKMRR